MSNKVYVGDVGTVIIVDCGQDISTGSNLSLKVQKPDGTDVSWTTGIAVYQTNYLKYTIQSEDLDIAGIYRVHASLTLGTWTGLGETALFTVYEPYWE